MRGSRRPPKNFFSRSKTIHHGVLIAIVLLVFFSTLACSALFGNPGRYWVRVLNHTDKGLTLPHFVASSAKREWLTYQIDPIEPGFVNAETVFEKFTGYDKDIPDRIEIRWQLFELSNCEVEYFEKSKIKGDSDSHLYRHAFGCKWAFSPIKEFRKTLDLSFIRKTKAYKNAGTSAEGAFRTNELVIVLEFRGEDLLVRSEPYVRGFK